MLILLDIDGVMVPAKGWKAPELHSDGFPLFTAASVRVLQNLVCARTVVVLTTSHKGNFSIGEWKKIFSKRGISIANLECLPTNIDQLSRKDEVVSWLEANDAREDFVIIDDDRSLNDLPDHLKQQLVLTGPHIGLTGEHLDIIRTILRTE